ncbi:hypothetical protein ATZ33_01235 [Enterococcus silesiacus]|uniref:DUF5067 domain-containing protein n=2 Tax=Enterococcus silesiacus TaxID=332949 RepID=A0ABM5W4Y2_9ENTE|nr:hypothetical protein [Enterococcus silesiacus]ALS00054.1 hypothetical protein ATZ33_01235 [Enterococcus silesiacus]
MKKIIGEVAVCVILVLIGLMFRTKADNVDSVSKSERKKYGETIFNYMKAETYFNSETLEASLEVKKIKLVIDFYGQDVDKDSITVYLNQTVLGLDESGQDVYGSNFPVIYTLEKQKEGYKVIHYEEPRDGSFYQEDIKRMFPEKKFGPLNKLKSGNIAFEEEVQ